MNKDSDFAAPAPRLYEHVLLWAGTAACLLSIYFVWQSDSRWWWSLVAGALLLIFGNLHRVAKFSLQLTGVSAETRSVTTQVRNLLPELKKLALLTGMGVLENAITSGRMGGLTPERYDALRANVIATLSQIGLDSGTIQNGLLGAERTWVLIDYVGGISRLAHRIMSADRSQEWNEFWKPYNKGHERPDAATLLHFLEKVGAVDDKVREFVEDYRVFREEGRHRRPEVWTQRASWLS